MTGVFYVPRSLSGNIRPQSSQLAEPLLTDPGIQSVLGVHELISTVGNEWSHVLPKSMQARSLPMLGQKEACATVSPHL